MKARHLLLVLLALLAAPARAAGVAGLEEEFMRLVRAEKYVQALPLGQRLLPIAEQAVGPNDPRLAKILNNVAWCAVRAGDPVVAEPLIRRASRIAESTPQPPAMLKAQIAATLGEVLASEGHYRDAIAAFQDAVNQMTVALGADHDTTLQTRQLLAIACQDQGDLNCAESIFQDLAKRNEARYGANDPVTALALRDLATVYIDIRDFSRAQPLLERALAIFERAVGANDPMTSYVLEDLAGVYADQGRARDAIPLLERAVRIEARAAGPDSQDMATSLNNLATVSIQAKEFGKAADALRRALPIVQKGAPPRLAGLLFNLSSAEYGLGHLPEAETLARRALALREQSLGAQHPLTAVSLDSVATLALEQGRSAEALELARRKAAAEDAVLANTLSFTSEEQRFAFLARLNPYTIFAMTGDADALANAVLRRKGLVLDSIIEDRRRGKSDPAVDDLRAARRALSKLELAGGQPAAREEIRKRITSIEAALARGAGERRALGANLADVQRALPVGAVLVEYIRYLHRLGQGRKEARYGAVVISAGEVPRWIPLGDAVALEERVHTYQAIARGEVPQRALRIAPRAPPTNSLADVLHALDAALWKPVEAALPAGTRTVILSPDGELNFVSFATLLGDDDRFIGERLSIGYVGSGRDLLRQVPATRASSVEIFANADFDGGASVGSGARSRAGGFEGASFGGLPGTAREASALRAVFPAGQWTVTVHDRAAAQEAQLYGLRAPRILHLATHGFFLPEIDLESTRLQDPMLRSGLAFSGANRTLAAWSRGESIPSDNDGILTAEEVGSLSLAGTWLVVLSACDTGGGQARSGEGVLGLRRGFAEAGAQNLLMTLWPVADIETGAFMVDFYKRVLRGISPAEALVQTQREWLVRLRKERGLAAAVSLAGPFILSAQGTTR